MKCIEAKSMFSLYLDGAVTGTEMLRSHPASRRLC